MFGMRPGFEVTKETYLAIFHRLGLDRPLYVQYFDWLWKLLNGDFGYSYVRGIPVREYIVRRTMNTLPLTAVGLLLSIAIAIPTGIVAAVNLHKAKDMVATSFATLMWSLPWFWYELMLILLFSVYLGWFPTYGMAEPGSSLFEQARHMFLPAFAYGTLGAGFLARITRSSMLEVLGQDYIVTARSKGLKERIVIYKHALGNAMLPIVTVMGLYFGMLIGGAAITETVFAWPGMGSLIVQAANERDYPVVMGLTVLISVFVTTCVLLTDIIYALLDPRIRY
jgi:peptide/nickel transport system permease protein